MFALHRASGRLNHIARSRLFADVPPAEAHGELLENLFVAELDKMVRVRRCQQCRSPQRLRRSCATLRSTVFELTWIFSARASSVSPFFSAPGRPLVRPAHGVTRARRRSPRTASSSGGTAGSLPPPPLGEPNEEVPTRRRVVRRPPSRRGPADGAGLLQHSQATVAWRHAETDPLGSDGRVRRGRGRTPGWARRRAPRQ